jgi:probable F420-dependent oxidoreductase
MEFGVVAAADPPASRLVDTLREAERLGFGYGWTFDSTVPWQDPFVVFARVLAATERLRVGPLVTNPGTRDWSVLASLFATLNDMFGNRTVCAIGRGDSALRAVGRRPQPLEAVAACMRAVKDLAEGRETILNGVPVRIAWVRGGRLPMWMAAYGPRALRLVGEQADGFVLQGADPDIARWTIGTVREAAKEAGRDPAAITVCVSAPAYVCADPARGREQTRWFADMVGRHVPDLVERYGAAQPVPRALSGYLAARAARPDGCAPDEIADRFCLLGPPAAHRERLAELAELGVDQFALYLMHDQPEQTLQAYGRDVIPALR